MVIFWRLEICQTSTVQNQYNQLSAIPNTSKIDVLDIEVSAGPGVINREFVESSTLSVEYSFDDARHMFDGRKAENIPHH